MTEKVICNKHGENAAAFVCSHILVTLRDKTARGFHWQVDEEGNYQAFCDYCWNMDDDEWEEIPTSEKCVLLCQTCYEIAADLNQIDLSVI